MPNLLLNLLTALIDLMILWLYLHQSDYVGQDIMSTLRIGLWNFRQYVLNVPTYKISGTQ